MRVGVSLQLRNLAFVTSEGLLMLFNLLDNSVQEASL